MLDRLDNLPRPQADALQISFGLLRGAPPTTFLVGLGVLTLLSDLAAEEPVLWAVDDAQWADEASMQVLGFVARRLEAESTVIMFAARGDPPGGLAGLPELPVSPLSNAQSRTLLSSASSGPLDSKVADRIVVEAQGNPLAVLELPRGSAPGAVAGGLCGSCWILDLNSDRGQLPAAIEGLPADTRRLLLIAAAEPLGDPGLLWAAADSVGLSVSVLDPASADGLLSIRTHVAFRHPIVRSVVYDAAEPEERRLVHRALAAVMNPATDPDRRAWHRAQASAQPDEDVAAELERSAKRAHDRGGLAAEAAFMQRAAELTPAGAPRAQRALTAVDAKLRVGALEDARELLELVRRGSLEPPADALAELAHAHVEYASGAATAPALLLGAAERLAGLAPELSREVFLQAILAADRVGTRSRPNIRDVCVRAASSARPAPQPPRLVDMLLDGYVLMYVEGNAAAARRFEKGLVGFRDDASLGKDPGVGLAAMRVAAILRDDTTWRIVATLFLKRHVQPGRFLSCLPPSSCSPRSRFTAAGSSSVRD